MANQKSIPLLEPNLVKSLGLTRLRSLPILEEWLDAQGELSALDLMLLNNVRNKLMDNADAWNEEELKMTFISMVIFITDFNVPISVYYEREISETIHNLFLKCEADMMLSKGVGELFEAPYFFLHEYKREKKYSGDPIGQMLGAMLIAQAKNNNGKPIYGCYVQGRFWFFSVLIGKTYCISHSFDATNEQKCLEIVLILRKLKAIILEKLMVD